jgi:hypothetical protein
MSTFSEKRRAAYIKRLLAWRERVFSRQPSYGYWGPSYTPAILATPDEAPTGSSPSSFVCRRLQRAIHALGFPEAVFCALAAHNLKVWEFHENHVLLPWPSDHPLACHPLYGSRPWPSTRGTIQIVAELGSIKAHPRVPAFSIDGMQITDGNAVLAWIGDLLLFLYDDGGQPYCLDWDIKKTTDSHGKPWAGDWRRANSSRAVRRASLRNAAHEAYMAELQIGIRRVALDEIDQEVARNLIRLCSRYQSEVALPDTMVLELRAAFDECMRTGDVPLDVIKRFVREVPLQSEAGRVLDHAVWERRIRADLWRPILIDQPLIPERIDILEHFGHWFAKEVPDA